MKFTLKVFRDAIGFVLFVGMSVVLIHLAGAFMP
jgi:hypothetical protein